MDWARERGRVWVGGGQKRKDKKKSRENGGEVKKRPVFKQIKKNNNCSC